MSKRKYTHVQGFPPEILERKAVGKAAESGGGGFRPIPKGGHRKTRSQGI